MAIVYGDFMYYVKLKQPIVDREELEHLYSELPCVGVTALVQIFHQVEYKLIDCLHDGSRTDLGSFHNSESDERSCKFVIGDSTDFFTAVRGLSENLSSLGVDGTVFRNIVNAIIDYGRHRHKHVANRGRKVLPLHVSIKKEKRVYLHYGRYLMHMATIRESTAQHTDDGVVPASVPALGKLLKRVRMDEGESENPSRRTTTTESDDDKRPEAKLLLHPMFGGFWIIGDKHALFPFVPWGLHFQVAVNESLLPSLRISSAHF